MLSVRGLSAGLLAGIGLTLRAGEILGLWGLLGSGRTEIMRALVGLDPIDAGEIRLRRAEWLEPTVPAALHAEVGFVTEDRRGEGLLQPLSVAANIAYANLDKLTNRVGLIVAAASAALRGGSGPACRHRARERRAAGAHALRR